MNTLHFSLTLVAFSTLSALAAGTAQDDGKSDVLYAFGGDEHLVAEWNERIRLNRDLEYSKLNHQIFEIRQDEQRMLDAEIPVQWTDEDTEWWWTQIADAATNQSAKTRFKLADGERGEGLLETFGTQYLPNAYENYQEARAIAKERIAVLNENFPAGRMSDATGGGLYEKVKKATAKAVAEMFRRHDELCHFHLLHLMGVVTDRELSELDTAKISIVLPDEGPEPLAYAKVPVELTSEERNFAQKYLPETWNVYERLVGFFSSGVKSYADWRCEAILVDATRSTPAFRAIAELLDSVREQMNGIVRSFKEMKLLHAVGETSAEELAKFDTETALKFLLFANQASLSASAKTGMENGIDFSKANRLATKNRERDDRINGIHANTERRISEARAKTENYIENENRRIFEELQRPARERVVLQLLDTIVKIPGKNYSMGKFEVTQIQWGVVMGGNPSHFKGVDNPVECVSWYDCQEFLEKLNSLTKVKESGLKFRLPTKEEWEFSCRAGSVGKENFCRIADGRDVTKSTLGKVAWFNDISDGKTHPVGKKTANAFGLFDMLGNVAEWCQDEGGSYWDNDLNRYSNNTRIHAGRSYGLTEDDLRFQGYFNYNLTKARGDFVGFRLCADGVARDNWRHPETESETIRTLIADMVQIPGKNYLMGKYEVTQAQWEAVMGDNPSQFKSSDNPVENVSWQDCQLFLEKLNGHSNCKKSGLTFRLPTEAEWEFACRAGATGDYCRLVNGVEMTEESLGQVAWFGENSNQTSHPVGQKQPNAFGLYDMHGNVYEWTATAEDGNRVYRGGSWGLSCWECRSAWRDSLGSSTRLNCLGFRLCASGGAD